METLKNILLYLWQLPQNLVGLIIRLIIKGEVRHEVAGIKFWFYDPFPGGISLGNMVMIGSKYELTVRHEYGHQIQSKILGPLYLLVIGLPSIAHAALCKCKNHSYYDMWFEKWADKIAGIKR